MFSTGLLVLYDDRQTELHAKNAEIRELKALEDRERIRQELEKLQIQIKPVLKLATEKYPTLNIDVALQKLYDDIQDLQRQNTELKEKVEPHHLTVNQRLAIKSVLSVAPKNLKGIYVCSIAFDEEAASYLKDLKEVLQQLGFKVVTVPAVRGGVGVRILTRRNTIPETISRLSDALSKAGIKYTMGELEETGNNNLEKYGPFPCLYIGTK